MPVAAPAQAHDEIEHLGLDPREQGEHVGAAGLAGLIGYLQGMAAVRTVHVRDLLALREMEGALALEHVQVRTDRDDAPLARPAENHHDDLVALDETRLAMGTETAKKRAAVNDLLAGLRLLRLETHVRSSTRASSRAPTAADCGQTPLGPLESAKLGGSEDAAASPAGRPSIHRPGRKPADVSPRSGDRQGWGQCVNVERASPHAAGGTCLERSVRDSLGEQTAVSFPCTLRQADRSAFHGPHAP